MKREKTVQKDVRDHKVFHKKKVDAEKLIKGGRKVR